MLRQDSSPTLSIGSLNACVAQRLSAAVGLVSSPPIREISATCPACTGEPWGLPWISGAKLVLPLLLFFLWPVAYFLWPTVSLPLPLFFLWPMACCLWPGFPVSNYMFLGFGLANYQLLFANY